jgi:hypothetical protein
MEIFSKKENHPINVNMGISELSITKFRKTFGNGLIKVANYQKKKKKKNLRMHHN